MTTPTADLSRPLARNRRLAAPPDEARLVRRAREGDERAFEILVARYQPRISRQVARIVKRHEDVEDVVQEVFISAYRALPAFEGDSLFHTWLFRIAHNAALNLVTRQPRFLVLADDLDAGDLRMPEVGGGAEPERLLIAKRISETVARAMEALAPAMAQPLLLFEVDGHDYRAIARMLDIPIGTVRTRIHRARAHLARALDPVVDTPLRASRRRPIASVSP